jgi:tetratricopeptide (TPR) repeat protein
MSARSIAPRLRLRRVALCILVLVGSAAGAIPRHLDARQEIFERGNQLYQEGDFAAAIEAYEAVLSAGYEGVDLYYNLGNAYFKAGDLGPSILMWERARELAPADTDVQANLELARSLTADAVQPLPRFWLLSAMAWWVRLVPRGPLIALVAAGWLLLTGGLVARILARADRGRGLGSWVAVGGAAIVLVFGTNLAVRELGVGAAERAVILEAAVPVRSAPSDDDDLTLFEVHEGTLVRIDQRAGDWAEVVLEDGKVGWVPIGVMGVI